MNKPELVNEGIKSAPPVAVAGLTVAGMTLNDVVLLVTIVYLVVQISYILYKWWRLHKGSK
jgi:hypothetical protein